MTYRQKASSKCPCRSGKKYKNCCKKKDDAAKAFAEFGGKFARGELPFFAEVISDDGADASMEVSSAFVDLGRGPQLLFEDEITLSTGSSDGDKIEKSSAQITVPVNRLEDPKIVTAGNASVRNKSSSYSISLLNDVKKLKIKSESGLFAVIRVVLQRNANYKYLDVLFGSKGESEDLDKNGKKTRPHIAFYADGNSKFIRLSNYGCELTNEMGYEPKGKSIFPAVARIYSNIHNESIVIEFEFRPQEKEVVVMGAKFEEKT